MSKYDFEIDLSQNSSTGIILSKIEKGSVVLEFGCATGRMTRYMKEALECEVYIVEYDQEAYNTALAFAEDGLCDDILNYRWVEKFAGLKFDAILFADVLEHLTAPEQVLEQASALLKNTGSIYISLPNITHNDILLKATEDRFDYTQTGLLDDTHVHFWGLKNLETLSVQYGLNIRSIEGTYCPTGYSEQYNYAGTAENLLLQAMLKHRPCGEVYQFVISLDKREGIETSYNFKTPSIQSHIYLDTGSDFNERERIDLECAHSGNGCYTIHHEIADAANVKRIRFDPIEGQGCILRYISIQQGRRALSLNYPNASAMGNGTLLPGNDPYVFAECLSQAESITVDAEIVVFGTQYMDLIQSAYVEQCRDLDRVQGEVHGLSAANAVLQQEAVVLTGEKKVLQQQVATLSKEKNLLSADVAALVGENANLQRQIDHLSSENEDLRTDIGSYILLANSKDKYAMELEGELSRYKSMKVVRLHFFAIRLINGGKRRVKQILKKVYKMAVGK